MPSRHSANPSQQTTLFNGTLIKGSGTIKEDTYSDTYEKLSSIKGCMTMCMSYRFESPQEQNLCETRHYFKNRVIWKACIHWDREFDTKLNLGSYNRI